MRSIVRCFREFTFAGLQVGFYYRPFVCKSGILSLFWPGCGQIKTIRVLHSGKKSVLLECIGRGDVRFVAKIGLDPIAKIEKEADSLWALSGIVGVPRCNSYGMSAFGPTLLMCGVGQTFSAAMLCRFPDGTDWSVSGFPVIVEIARCLVPVLQGMHARGFLHRDIAPDNFVWLPDEHRWQLIDFGSTGKCNSKDRTFLVHSEFASDRLAFTTEPLSSEDDFDALARTLTFLLRQNRIARSTRWAADPVVIELVAKLRGSTSKEKCE